MRRHDSISTAVPVDPGAACVLVLDFDGTVCLGDGPVWAYADAAFNRIEDAHTRQHLRERLTDFLTSGADVARYQDGYFAVQGLASSYLDADALDLAYAESRDLLATATDRDVHAPDGLHGFLSSFDNVARVLFTNAPRSGVVETLTALGLTDVIDAVIANAGKPAGYRDALPRLLGGRQPSHLLSVGDVYDNDIAIPLEFGCATAFINRFGHVPGPSHLHAPTFEEMYDDIDTWARDPSAFIQAFAPQDTPQTTSHTPTAPAKDQS